MIRVDSVAVVTAAVLGVGMAEDVIAVGLGVDVTNTNWWFV